MKKRNLLFKVIVLVGCLFANISLNAQFATGYTTSSITYSWDDLVASSGTNVSTTSCDDCNYNLTIPFTFNYYCNSYTTVNVNTNGLMMFGSTGSDYSNVCIPSTATPNNIIAAFWDDLNFDYGCSPTYFRYQTFGSAPNRRFVVSWIAFRLNSGSCGTYVYTQAKLFETSNIIEIHIQSNATGAGGTIGIENSAGTAGNQVLCNTATTNGVAYRFTPNTTVNPSFGSNIWNVMGYDGSDVNLGSGAFYKGYYTESALSYTSTSKWASAGSPSDATGWTGCPVGADNHTVVSKRTGVPSNGVYSVSVNYHDDNMQFYSGGTNQFESPYCCMTHTDVYTGYMDNTTNLEMRQAEGGGGSGQGLTFTQQNLSATVSKTDLTQNSTCGTNNGTITFSNPSGAVASPVFRSNFSAATGVTVSGSASVTSGYLQLTPNSGSQLGGAILANSTACNASVFRGEFDFRIWDGSAADGISFNYADMSGSPSNSGENGYGNGLSVCFVTYSGAGGPFVKIKYAGTQVGSNYSVTLRDANFRQCVVTVNSSNQLSLSIAGTAIISGLALPSAFQTTDKTNWQFSFAGRTGGSTDAHRVDNVVINAYNQYEYSINGSTWNNTGVFTGLAPGTYTPRIRNKAFSAYPTSLSNVTIGEPPVINISSTVTNETCPTSNNGSIDVTMTGGMSQVRYIRLNQNKTDADAYINLSELQAYEIFTGTNVALSKTVTYNSVHSSGSYPGSELVNGITATTSDMYHSNGTGSNEWVEVDLGAEYAIDNIRIWNRNDCCWDRSSNFQLVLKNGSGAIVYSNAVNVHNGVSASPGASPTFNVIDVAWSPTKTTLDLTGQDAGSYTLSYSDAAGCSASHAKTIGTTKTESTAASTATATSLTICNGNSTTLSITGGTLGTGASWKWYSGSCGGTLVGTGSGATATLAVSPTATTTYYVRAEGDCNNTTCVSVTITVNNPPTAPTTVSSSAGNTLCNGTGTTLSFSGGTDGSGATYEWFSGSCGSTVLATTATYNVTPTATTTYYVRRKGNTACTAATTCASLTVTVDPTSVGGTVSGGTSPICEGSATGTMTLSGHTGSITKWQKRVNSGSWTDIANTSTTYSETPSSPGVWDYRTEVKSGVCNAVNSSINTITVNAAPAITSVTAGTNPLTCGSTTTLTANGVPSPGNTVTWWTGTGGTGNNLGTGTTLANADGGIYFARVTSATCPTPAEANITVTSSAPNNVILVGSTVSNTIDTCDNADWTYYEDPGTGDYIFAIAWNGNSGRNTATVSINTGSIISDEKTRSGGVSKDGSFVMGRYWNVNSAGTLTNPVKIRFYYNPSDLTAVEAARDAAMNAWNATNPPKKAFPTPSAWFKTVGIAFTPASQIVDGNDFSGFSHIFLTPSATGTDNGVNYVQFDGITSFSGGGFGAGYSPGSGAPLPVTYLSFKATPIENSYIRLDWATASERDNKGFVIERSEDGRTWQNIGWKDGNGTTTAVMNYSYNDQQVAPNVVYYYRLRQTDYSGREELSNIVAAKILGEDKFEISEFIPTKVEGTTTVNIATSTDRTIMVKVVDMLGQTVYQTQHQATVGNSSISFDFSHLAAGTYAASFTSNGEYAGRKFVVVR